VYGALQIATKILFRYLLSQSCVWVWSGITYTNRCVCDVSDVCLSVKEYVDYGEISKAKRAGVVTIEYHFKTDNETGVSTSVYSSCC